MALRHPFNNITIPGVIEASSSRAIILLAGLLAIVWLLPVSTLWAKRPESAQHYGKLLAYIRGENRNRPLVEFKQMGQGVDDALSRENRQFISKNEALLDQIRTELDSEELHWQLRTATQRLMVVPEKHPEYAALFEDYCHNVVDYVLRETNLPNPYGAIATFPNTPSQVPSSGDSGITAYLVHNIADVYTEEYVFFDDRRQNRKISIKLDNRSYRGEVGSYSSYLVIEGEQHFRFERNAYTLWRNSAEDPLNVFIAPVEETLHIALRDATESAIQVRLRADPPAARSDIETVVEEWLAIEEAVVGGLVNELMPAIIDRFLSAEASLDLARSITRRQAFDKYRYLEEGVALVGRLGMQPAIRFYLDQPQEFKALLIDTAPDTATPPVKAAEEKMPEDPTA